MYYIKMSSNTTMLKEILQQLSVISIKVDKIDKIESDTEIIKKDINTLKKDVESLKQHRVEIKFITKHNGEYNVV